MAIKIILTGGTGMVGEGVLLECLQHAEVSKVLSISRRPCGHSHPKLTEYIVPDFLTLDGNDPTLAGYDACFFCAGVSSIGMKEPEFTRLTYDTTLHFAKAVLLQNAAMTFIYVSGKGTDSSEQGRQMWARVKGKTENDLQKLGFKHVYNFRPGFMKAMPGQQHLLKAYTYFSWMYPLLKLFWPGSASTIQQVARAMIRCVTDSPSKNVIEVSDIHALGN